MINFGVLSFTLVPAPPVLSGTPRSGDDGNLTPIMFDEECIIKTKDKPSINSKVGYISMTNTTKEKNLHLLSFIMQFG